MVKASLLLFTAFAQDEMNFKENPNEFAHRIVSYHAQ